MSENPAMHREAFNLLCDEKIGYGMSRSVWSSKFNEGDKMKSILLACVVVMVLAGCTSSTEFGPCVGIGEDKNPALQYKLSANNLVWAILGFEIIAPPVIVAVNEIYCPVGRK